MSQGTKHKPADGVGGSELSIAAGINGDIRSIEKEEDKGEFKIFST